MEQNLRRSGVEGKFFDLCTMVAKNLGYELYDLEYIIGSKLLRVYIMNPQTKTALIDDCVKMDDALTPYFESETWMPQEITLEVSSPGIYRNIRTLDHFQKALGNKVAFVLNKSLSGEEYSELPRSITTQKKLIAKLVEVKDSALAVEIETFKFNIKLDDIKKANIEA